MCYPIKRFKTKKMLFPWKFDGEKTFWSNESELHESLQRKSWKLQRLNFDRLKRSVREAKIAIAKSDLNRATRYVGISRFLSDVLIFLLLFRRRSPAAAAARLSRRRKMRDKIASRRCLLFPRLASSCSFCLTVAADVVAAGRLPVPAPPPVVVLALLLRLARLPHFPSLLLLTVFVVLFRLFVLDPPPALLYLHTWPNERRATVRRSWPRRVNNSCGVRMRQHAQHLRSKMITHYDRLLCDFQKTAHLLRPMTLLLIAIYDIANRRLSVVTIIDSLATRQPDKTPVTRTKFELFQIFCHFLLQLRIQINWFQ